MPVYSSGLSPSRNDFEPHIFAEGANAESAIYSRASDRPFNLTRIDNLMQGHIHLRQPLTGQRRAELKEALDNLKQELVSRPVSIDTDIGLALSRYVGALPADGRLQIRFLELVSIVSNMLVATNTSDVQALRQIREYLVHARLDETAMQPRGAVATAAQTGRVLQNVAATPAIGTVAALAMAGDVTRSALAFSVGTVTGLLRPKFWKVTTNGVKYAARLSAWRSRQYGVGYFMPATRKALESMVAATWAVPEQRIAVLGLLREQITSNLQFQISEVEFREQRNTQASRREQSRRLQLAQDWQNRTHRVGELRSTIAQPRATGLSNLSTQTTPTGQRLANLNGRHRMRDMFSTISGRGSDLQYAGVATLPNGIRREHIDAQRQALEIQSNDALFEAFWAARPSATQSDQDSMGSYHLLQEADTQDFNLATAQPTQRNEFIDSVLSMHVADQPVRNGITEMALFLEKMKPTPAATTSFADADALTSSVLYLPFDAEIETQQPRVLNTGFSLTLGELDGIVGAMSRVDRETNIMRCHFTRRDHVIGTDVANIALVDLLVNARSYELMLQNGEFPPALCKSDGTPMTNPMIVLAPMRNLNAGDTVDAADLEAMRLSEVERTLVVRNQSMQSFLEQDMPSTQNRLTAEE